MFHKILDGVNTFHKAGILHRDLKPENIFLHGNQSIKIGDFGLALSHSDRSKEYQLASQHGLYLTHEIGTLWYMAPEMKNNSTIYDQKADIYSLGIIFFEMLLEFGSAHEKCEVITKLVDKKIPDSFKREFPEESQLILRMLNPIPEKRPDAGEIIAAVLKMKSQYYNQKFIKEKAEVIGYNGQVMDLPSSIKSILVQNTKGVFSIRQGLKEEVISNPPSKGKIITFKYEVLNAEGLPVNPIYKG